MNKTVTATQARVHLGELLDSIEHNRSITVEQAGNAETVMIPVCEADELSGLAGSPDWRQSLERAQASFARDPGDRPRQEFVQILREMREQQSTEPTVIHPEPSDWRQAFADVRTRMRDEVGDKAVDTDEIIHKMREERVAELFDGLC